MTQDPKDAAILQAAEALIANGINDNEGIARLLGTDSRHIDRLMCKARGVPQLPEGSNTHRSQSHD